MESEPCQGTNDHAQRGAYGDESSEAGWHASREPSVRAREEFIEHYGARQPHRDRPDRNRDQNGGTNDEQARAPLHLGLGSGGRYRRGRKRLFSPQWR
jgi:hypothetical protein